MAKFMPRALLLTVLLSGCASLPENTERSEKDPWEPYNRAVYNFNDAVDRAVLRPVAKGYRAVTPDPVERGVSNFFDNLTYPIVAVNQFLQGDFGDGMRDTGRFLFNTIFGLGGIFDPATGIGLEENSEDFGQTLGVWGVPEGPYFVLPFLGPSTVRDSVGTYVDSEMDPSLYYVESPEKYYLLGLRIIDLRAQLLDVDSQLENTYDPYTFLRDAYLQRREYLVHDGNLQRNTDFYDDLYNFEDMEDTVPPSEDTASENDESGSTEPDSLPKEDIKDDGTETDNETSSVNDQT
ncbi:MAG TPA: VacJ family lipoprotein [Gammaproteobacteria bacterium]